MEILDRKTCIFDRKTGRHVYSNSKTEQFIMRLSAQFLIQNSKLLIRTADAVRFMLLVLTVKALHFHAELVWKDGVKEYAYEGGESQA